MGKIIWTTIFWFLVLIIAGFYLKFMDQETGEIISSWITDQQVGVIGVDISDSDSIQQILSGVTTMQQQLVDGFQNLNLKLDETKVLLGAEQNVVVNQQNPVEDTIVAGE